MLNIRRMGCHARHPKDFAIHRPNGYDCCLLLFVKSRAWFILDGKMIITDPDTFIIYNKYSPHKYGAYQEEYVNHWIQAELPDDICSGAAILFDRPIHIGAVVKVDEYMHLISDAFFRKAENRIISNLLAALFGEINSITLRPLQQNVHLPGLLTLRKQIYAAPNQNWSIKDMAAKLHVSEPYFQELYKKSFGISCGADVINSRLEAAKLLLADTTLPAFEIGKQCGYKSPVHFSRQFKQFTGYSPTEYRKQQ